MLRNVFCVFVAIFWTAFWFPATLVMMLIRLNRSASMGIVRGPWARGLVWAGGGQLEVRGAENVDLTRPQIFVSNHQSTIDIPVLFISLPTDARFVSKKALMYVPFMGWYMWLARFVFVDRGNPRVAMASIDRAAEQIRGGISIIMFPEGTRSESRRVLPFKKGPFALAVKAGVPIVPVAIEGSGRLMPKNSWNITPGPIKVAIGQPIDPAAYIDSRDGLIKRVRTEVIALHKSIGGLGAVEEDPSIPSQAPEPEPT